MVISSGAGTQWTDVVGGNNLTPVSAGPPAMSNTLNNKTAFDFQSNSYTMTGPRISSIEGISGLTVWSVGRQTQFGHEGGGARSAFFYLPYSDGVAYCGVDVSNYGTIAMNAVSGYMVGIFVFDGTLSGNANRLKLYINGVQKTLSFTGTIPAVTTTNASMISKVAYLSTSQPGVSLEHGIIARAITATELTAMHAYFAKTYPAIFTGNVYFYGNSITYGYNTADHYTYSWPHLVSTARGWAEVNYGLVGNSLSSAVPVNGNNCYDNRAKLPVKTAQDKYIILSYGVNDAGYNNGNYTTAVFTTQYNAVISTLISKGWDSSNIILHTGFLENGWIPNSGGGGGAQQNQAGWQTFIDATKAVAATNGLLCIDETGVYTAGDNQADQVHPAASGHVKIAAYVGSLIH